MKEIIKTDKAPSPVGTYSQAVKCNNVIYCAGQIALDPRTNTMVTSSFKEEAMQVFNNLAGVCEAAGGKLNNIVKLTIYLMDFNDFSIVNEVMKELFVEPYPARTTIQVSLLPKGANIEVDAILVI